MYMKDNLLPLKIAENVSLKEGIDGIIDVIKITEGYSQSTTFDNNPKNFSTSAHAGFNHNT